MAGKAQGKMTEEEEEILKELKEVRLLFNSLEDNLE